MTPIVVMLLHQSVNQGIRRQGGHNSRCRSQRLRNNNRMVGTNNTVNSLCSAPPPLRPRRRRILLLLRTLLLLEGSPHRDTQTKRARTRTRALPPALRPPALRVRAPADIPLYRTICLEPQWTRTTSVACSKATRDHVS